MAIYPIPVTYHVHAEPRPELLEARRRRALPYKTISQAIFLFTVMGAGIGLIASGIVHVPKAAVAPTAWREPATVAVPAFLSSLAPAPARQMATGRDPLWPSYDPTPVGTIPGGGAMPVLQGAEAVNAASGLASGREPALARGFAPVERSPHYSGFKVIAGH